MEKYQAIILVWVQFTCLGLLAVTGPVIPNNPLPRILYITGVFLGVWAVLKAVRKSKLRITPEIARDAKLMTDGPYKYIRHPMYSGVLLVSLSLVVSYPDPIRICILIILAADLAIKMNFEEKLLEGYFSNYKEYKRFTRKLIPYLY